MSLLLLIFKVKRSDEYIPFGPFIVISAILAMIIPEEALFGWLWALFSGKWLISMMNK